MVKIKDTKRVPDLRFPGFKREWECISLGDMLTFISTNSLSRSDLNYEDGEIKNIHYGDIHKIFRMGFDATKERVPYINKTIDLQKITKDQFCQVGDVVIADASEDYNDIGKSIEIIHLDGNKILAGLHTFLGRDKTNQTVLGFKGYLLKSGWVRKQIQRFSQGISVLGISKKNLAKVRINLPQKDEQEKIAGFLSAVDKKIQQLAAKKDLLEQYKKGVMQQIFSQEIRFKDDNGKDYPDWQEKKLGEILTFISTNSLSRSDLNYEDGEIKNIHYGDIHTTFKMGFDATKQKVPFINKEINLSNVSEEQFCQVGDLVIADASEDYNDVAKTIEVYNLASEKILAGLHTFLARDTKNHTVVGFKGYLLRSSLVRKQIQRFAQGISVLGISKKNLAKVKFELPHKDEQNKIAAFLRRIDKKIDSVQRQLEQTQAFKKGLLQQLFV